MESPLVYGDELMLYVLARTFQCHVVFNKHKCWTTIRSNEYITRQHLLELCDIHLVYIGQHMFAELHQKPFETEKKPTILESPKSNLHGLVNTTNANEYVLPLDLQSAANKTVSSSEDSQSDHESEQDSMENDLTSTNGYSSAPNTQGSPMPDDITETITDTNTCTNSNSGVISAIGSGNHQESYIHPTENMYSDGYEPRHNNNLSTGVRGLNVEVNSDCKNRLSTDASSDGCKQPVTNLMAGVIGSNLTNIERMPSRQTLITQCDGLEPSLKGDPIIHVMGSNTNVTKESSDLNSMTSSNSTTVSNVSTIYQPIPLKLLVSQML